MAASGKAITVRLVGDSTDFSISLTKAQLKLIELKGSADSLTRTLGVQAAEAKKAAAAIAAVGAAGHSSVSGMQASSASLRLLEGGLTNNIRAAERFIGTIPGLSNILKAAFPLVGGIALLGVLGEMFEHVQNLKKAFDDLQKGPQRVANEMMKMTSEAIRSQDTIDVTNQRLRDTIAKLEGKPSNGIALALIEARQRADELGQSITSDINKLDEVVKKESLARYGVGAVLLGKAPTTDITDTVAAYTQNNSDIERKANDARRNAKTEAERTAIAQQAEDDKRSNEQAMRAALLQKEKQDKVLQAQYQNAPTGQYLWASAAGQAPAIDQGQRLALEQGGISQADTTIGRIDSEKDTDKLAAKAKLLQAAKEQADAYKSVTKTLEELQAKIKGVSEETAAGTPVQQAHARAFAESEQVISRLKESLAEHALTLKASDAAQIRSMETTLADLELQKSTGAEFKKTIDGINEKIDAYQRLTAAIGAGYAAQRQASVADAVEKASIGKNYSPAQKTSIGAAAGQEFDSSNSQKTAADVDKLQEKTQTENALAAATLYGSEAVREAALGMEIERIARDNSTASAQKLIAATLTLAAAEERLKVNTSIERLTQETAAQERLNAARLQGADAVRAAQLNNQIIAIKSSTAPGAEQDSLIGAAKAQSQVAEQTRLLDLSTQIDFSNKAKLEDLDKQLALMQQIGASEIAIKETEAQRTELLDKIALQSGSFADVLRSAADKMAEAADHVKEQLQSAILELQSGINSQIAKMATGQKTDWAKMLKQQGGGLIQTGLKAVEGKALGAFGLGGGKKDGSSEASALYVRLAGSGMPGKGGIGIPGLGGASSGGSGSPALGDDGLPINPGTITPGLSDLSMGGGASSGIMGLLSKLTGGLFAGGFATGGDVPGSSVALVGEQGPELISTGPNGANVTPNKDLGGTTSNAYYSIDARGTDSVLVEARTRAAIVAAHGSAIAKGMQGTEERAKRMVQK